MLGEFLARFAFGNADTHDFVTVVKETTGENLDWFFEQWLFRPGHPVFRVSWDWLESSRKVRLSVSQVQDFSKGIPVYRLPVLIGLRTPAKNWSERVWLTEKEETFEFDAPEKPLLVRFDEGNYLLKELTFEKPSEELVFELQNDDAIGRLWAADGLQKFSGGGPAREALLQTARKDPFWAVRRAALETLVKTGGADLVPFFKEKLTDANSRVRASAVRALGDTKAGALAALFMDVFTRDSSYVVQAEALTAIGKCGGRDRIPFLKKAASMASPRDMLKRNAESAIKKIEGAPTQK